MIYDREMIEINENLAIGFIQHGDKYFEYLAPFFKLDFSEIEQKEIDDLISWCDESSTMIHKTELEYEFPIAYWDDNFMKNLKVPEILKPIFKALIIYGKNFNRNLPNSQKIIPCLKLWLPSESGSESESESESEF